MDGLGERSFCFGGGVAESEQEAARG